jgi:hypothetical protein
VEKTEAEHQEGFPTEQWGIRLTDGAVFPGYGNPASTLQIEHRKVDPQTIRLRIVLPEFKALTVVYTDSDDGQTQKSTLATSRLSYGIGSTLGTPKTIAPIHATCAVAKGRLEPVLIPRTDSECPLVAYERPPSCGP